MAEKIIKQLRDFPSVEELLQDKKLNSAVISIPRPMVAEIVKKVMADYKKKFNKGQNNISYHDMIKTILKKATLIKRKEISRVINATGVIIHTNLGRAPLSESIFDEVIKTVIGYSNVEFDLSRGSRGFRGEACEKYLALLSGAESATIVNNCAAALLIVLNSLANKQKVIISRGELVQIGGGFRIPDILKKSGAKLCEVGTTNITTLSDYENNLDNKTALILRVHQSNFTQQGFTEQVPLKDLVRLGNRHHLPVFNDLGSGMFIPVRKLLGFAEPTVQQSVNDNAAVTCFSGDKMLGGIQAGLIVGKDEYIKKIKRNPLFRTYRVDKIVFSMIEKLLACYLNNQWQTDIKLWSIISIKEAELYKRGKWLLKQIGSPKGINVETTNACVGGGALPGTNIPSVGVFFAGEYKATILLKKFRELTLPVIGRIENDRFVLDLKTVDECDLPYLVKVIIQIIK